MILESGVGVSGFVGSGVVRFSGVGSLGEARRLAVGLGGVLGVEFRDGDWGYVEDHSFVLGDGGVGDVVVPWHVESPNWFWPQLVGGWWFGRCRQGVGAGLTGFVDGRDLFCRVPVRFRGLLDGLSVVVFDVPGRVPLGWRVDGCVGGRWRVVFECVGGVSEVLWGHPVVWRHWDGRPVLRLLPDVGVWDVSRVAVLRDGVPVGGVEFGLVGELVGWVVGQLGLGGLQSWFEWVEGDFVLVDLLAGFHAVSGGFGLGERVLSGFWGHEVGCGVEPRVPGVLFE